MSIVLKNNAASALSQGINDLQTSVDVLSGAVFPNLSVGEYFYATIESTESVREIVKVTNVAGNTLTVVRAQDGTSAASFAEGSRVEARINAASVEDYVDQNAELSQYNQGAGTAVVRTIQEKLQDVVSVKDFGAVADWDGSTGTNNTAAFSAAIDYLGSIGGGTLIIPPGEYLGRLIINQSNISIKGYGATIGYLPTTTLRIQATQGTSNLAPFLGFTGTDPNNVAPGATFYNIVSTSLNSTDITVSDASGINPGDNIIVISREVTAGSTTATNFIPFFHQIVKVLSVVGNVITVDEPIERAITSSDPYSHVIKWDFVENINIEGITVTNLFGADYSVDFGGGINISFNNVVFNPESAWGAFATCRKVTFNNCIINYAYSGFSNGRMCDEITVQTCTVKCADNVGVSISQNYFYFCEENTKRLKIVNCNGINAGIAFYVGSEYTNINVSNSFFEQYKTGVSAFQLTTFESGSIVTCSDSTFISRGGTTASPWDLEPAGTIAVAFLSGFIFFGNCVIQQLGSGNEISNQRFATDNIRVYGDRAPLQLIQNSITTKSNNTSIQLLPKGTGQVFASTLGKPTVFSCEGTDVRKTRGVISAFQDDAITGKASFGVNSFSTGQYSLTPTRFTTDMSAWALTGTTGTSATSSTSTFRLIYVDDTGSSSSRWVVDATGNFLAGGDNTQTLGGASNRWSEVFAGNDVINTSDANEKQDIEEINEQEKLVALKLKNSIKKFRWKHAVEEKGDDARIHFGVLAQEVQKIFGDAGLNADKYGLFCKDIWYTKEEKYIKQIDNPDFNDQLEESEENPRQISGETKTKTVLCQPNDEGAVENVRYGIRYGQLLAFIISTL